MARYERSAGVIVFKSDKRVAGGRLYLLLDYGRFWDYPKGHLKKGEDDLAAALRELREETGVDDAKVIEGFRHEIGYFFRDRSEGLIRKTVVFFLAQTRTRNVRISHEHVGAEFLPYEKATERLTYKNAKEALAAAHEFLNNASR